jgi:hypothetical protein
MRIGQNSQDEQGFDVQIQVRKALIIKLLFNPVHPVNPVEE